MACVNSDGTLTASATAILQAVKSPSTPNQIAEKTGLALFRVRSGLREMIEARIVTESEGLYHVTSLGSDKVR